MVLEYRAAAELARRLGQDSAASLLREKAGALAARVERLLWYEDERGGTYVALRSRRSDGWEEEVVGHRDPDGVLRPLASWTGLLPLYAGIPSRSRAARLVERLCDPAGFWGPAGVRTVPGDSVFFHQARRVLLYDPRRGEAGPVSNWTGPVWALSSYYLARGLERYGEDERARELDARTLALLTDDLRRTGTLHECYDDEGRGLWPHAGGFVSWNVLALVLPGPVADPVLGLGDSH
jgi:putative isomerase